MVRPAPSSLAAYRPTLFDAYIGVVLLIGTVLIAFVIVGRVPTTWSSATAPSCCWPPAGGLRAQAHQPGPGRRCP
jgi:hypothetical protein